MTEVYPDAEVIVDAAPSPGGLLRSSAELDKLFEALSLAQGEMTDPAKNKTADLGRGGKYSYADLADLLKIIRPVFSRHGLCLLQFPVNPHRGSVTIVTRIGHKSGQWIEGDLTLLVGDDKPQTLGSSITYSRRYSAAAAAGMSPDDDDDAPTAQAAVRPQQHLPSPSPPPRAASVHDAARAAFEAGVPKKRDDAYDPKNPVHVTWLDTQLVQRLIPADRCSQVRELMIGRPSADLDEAIRKVTGS
jgi:hypothetical protein